MMIGHVEVKVQYISMDRESDSNLTEEGSFSVISNEEVTRRHYDVPNSQYRDRQGQNILNNQMFLHGHNNQNSNGQNISDQQMTYYVQNLCIYLRAQHPKIFENLMPFIAANNDDDMGRNTPIKFANNHSICKLDFPGIIYQVLSNGITQEGGTITISDEIYSQQLSEESLSDEYPGPLTVHRTTEEQIYSYLKDQMSMELQDSSPVDWDSGQLLINFLELLIKENGKPIPGNIVRLLNNGFELRTADLHKESRGTFEHASASRGSFSRASSRATSRASSRAGSPTNLLGEPDSLLPQNALDTSHQGPGSICSSVVIRRAANNLTSEQKLCNHMDKYRQFVLSGLFEEAVRYAAKSGLWDHAFALALRMNSSQLINEVLVSFSRRAIYSNDPLFTMHELMARKPPKITAANRGFSNNEMGDWRCHLGMILSVKKFRPEECRQSIEALGEKLAALRNYYAAHLCYILAGTPFGLDNSSTKYRRKFDLIGWQSSTSSIPIQKSTSSNCRRLFTGLKYWNSAPEQSIKLTEVYEYALKLKSISNRTQPNQNNDNEHEFETLSVHLLPYKYLMVYKMLSKHRVKCAYEYCIDIGEILGLNVNWLECESINFRIISNIRNLSQQLNSWLTSSEDSIYLHSNNDWLSNIDNIYELFCAKYRFWNPNSPKPDFSQQIIDNPDQSFSQFESGNLAINDYNSYSDNNPINTEPKHYHNQSNPSQRNINQFPSERIPYQNNIDLAIPTGNVQINPRQYRNESIGGYSTVPHNQIDYQKSQTTINNGKLSQIDKKIDQHSAFRDIAPPSELPNAAILTEPPRYAEMRHTTNSVVLDRNQYESQRLRFENQMKFPPNSEPIVPNKTQNLIYEQYNKPKYNPPAPPAPSQQQSGFIMTNRNAGFESSDSEYPLMGNNLPPVAISPGASSSEMKQPFTFMPASVNCDDDGGGYFDDGIVNYPQVGTRSRSQSNCSVGSGEHRDRPTRSRNSSESKDNSGSNHQVSNPRTLETTNEESESSTIDSIREQQQQQQQEERVKQEKQSTGWRLMSMFKSSRPKEIHLPKDENNDLVYDEKKQRWCDKSNPESEKPITPPPVGLKNLQLSQPYPDVSGNHYFVKSKYKPLELNVKQSTALVSPPPIPSFKVPPSMNSNSTSTLNGTQLNDNNPQFNSYHHHHHHQQPMGYGSSSSHNPELNNMQYAANSSDHQQIYQQNNYNLQPSVNSRNF